jgi:hypothetical protein
MLSVDYFSKSAYFFIPYMINSHSRITAESLIFPTFYFHEIE